MESFLEAEIDVEKIVCGAELKDGKRAEDLMLRLGLNGTIDQLAVANNVIGRLYLENGWLSPAVSICMFVPFRYEPSRYLLTGSLS